MEAGQTEQSRTQGNDAPTAATVASSSIPKAVWLLLAASLPFSLYVAVGAIEPNIQHLVTQVLAAVSVLTLLLAVLYVAILFASRNAATSKAIRQLTELQQRDA